MTHFRHNLRDLEFNLFEVFGADKILDNPAFADLDEATAREILTELARLSEEELAASYVEGDRNPPVFDAATNSVTLPEAFKKSYKAFIDAEYWRLDLPEVLGGTSAPRMLWWSLAELVLGANPALWMYAAGSSFAHSAYVEGTAEQQEWAKLFIEKGWGATMVLTEPDAGSDVGAGTTKAYKQPDGSWHIEGVKRFITSGDQDMTEQHRPLRPRPPRGRRGRRRPRHQGPEPVHRAQVPVRPGHGRARRAQRRQRHQHRAQDGPQGLGDRRAHLRREVPREGLAPRREARGHPPDVPHHRVRADDGGHQGHRHALHRLPQRARLREEPHPGPGPAPDPRTRPRRACRSSSTRTCAARCSCRRATPRACARSSRTPPPGRTRPAWPRSTATRTAAETAKKVNDLLLPLVKGCGSERAYQLLSDEVAADVRRVRATSRTTRSSSTCATRRSTRCTRAPPRSRASTSCSARSSRTTASRSWSSRARSWSPRRTATRSSKTVRGKVLRALGDVQGILEALQPALMAAMGDEPRELYKAGLHSRRLLLAVGDLMVGWLLLRQAEIAQNKLDAGRRRRLLPRARSPRRSSSPRRSCRASPPTARSSRPRT